MTCDAAERRDTPLARKARRAHRRTGPITVAEYVEACLHDPRARLLPSARRHRPRLRHRTRDQPDVRRADRTVVLRSSGSRWAAPTRSASSSSGPAAARMMRDMLSAARWCRISCAPCRFSLVETSAPLAAEQRSLLRDAPAPVAWCACARGTSRRVRQPSSMPTSSSMPCRPASIVRTRRRGRASRRAR